MVGRMPQLARVPDACVVGRPAEPARLSASGLRESSPRHVHAAPAHVAALTAQAIASPVGPPARLPG
jgi:hypothetical protein